MQFQFFAEWSTYVIKPIARPRHAPIAIVGRKIPAGIDMPKVQEVSAIFIRAVSINKKMFCRVAVGLFF